MTKLAHRFTPNLIRFPLMGLAALALLSGLWAALVRTGWTLPVLPPSIAGQHGPLMISGFLGTLIGVERAIARQSRWAYLVPLLSGTGTFALIVGLPPVIGRGLIALAALGLAAIFVGGYRRQPAAYVATMGLGALAWLGAGVLWLGGWPVYRVAPWWAGFLVLTIAGERLELARVLKPARASRIAFMLPIGLFLAGLLIALVSFERGMAVSGTGLVALGLWLLRHDIARYTIRQSGLTRFIAICLLPGYVWLMVSGGLWLLFGAGLVGGLMYDAMLHSLFLGFVFSMIFGHAPIILPAVVNVATVYHPAFYTHVALLHVSLVLRMWADLTPSLPLRTWAGLLNVIAILLFIVNTIRSVRRKSE